MISIHNHYNSDGAVTFNRLLSPARFCWKELLDHGVQLTCDNSLPDNVDWLCIHGVPPTMLMFAEIARIQHNGVKILWSLDDDWTTIPDWNPAKLGEEGLIVFGMMRKMADAIICSTEHLASTLDPYWDAGFSNGKPVVVAPNFVDIKTFPKSPYDDQSGFVEITKLQDEPVRIVWAGGKTHKGDIEVAENALCRILDKYGPRGTNKAAVVFMGDLLTNNLSRDHLHRGLIWQPPVPFAQYRKIANTLNPDIWIAPLVDIPFNRSKSNLRLMEGWALGGAVVASAVGDYNQIRTGVDGITIKDNDENASDRWFDVLETLIHDHSSRIQLAANGRGRATNEHDWNIRRNRLPWLQAYCKIAGVEPPLE